MTMLGKWGGLMCIVWTAAVSLAQAQENRVALVIGNGQYTSVPALNNPRRDAGAIADALRAAGFRTVHLANDLGFDAMRQTLRDFSAEADRADWAVIYYAGHGIEIGGQNYLIPVDARLKSDRDVAFEAVQLDQVLTSIEGARKLRLIILDACRDNPFVSQMARTIASRSIGRGLARVEPEGGTLVAYAAKAGQIALDGDGQNSPFVSALKKHIRTPGVEINMLFRAVRDDVLAATGKKQEPFVYGSLPNQSFFVVPATSVGSVEAHSPSSPLPAEVIPRNNRPSPTPAPSFTTPPESPARTLPDPAERAYVAAERQNTAEAWQAFLRSHKSGVYADLANAALRRLLANAPRQSSLLGTAAPCVVADPTGVPLNVRTGPNGAILHTLRNGVKVSVLRSMTSNGKSWALVSNGGGPALGWVFRPYIDCP